MAARTLAGKGKLMMEHGRLTSSIYRIMETQSDKWGGLTYSTTGVAYRMLGVNDRAARGLLPKDTGHLHVVLRTFASGSIDTTKDSKSTAVGVKATLETMNRSQLLNMCNAMNHTPDHAEFLRLSLLKKFQEMQAKDKIIKENGAKSLPAIELQQLCQERCLLITPSVEEMCEMLDGYVVSVPDGIPAEVLKFSRVSTQNYENEYLSKIYEAILEGNRYQKRMALAAEARAKAARAVESLLDKIFMAAEIFNDKGRASSPVRQN